MIRRGVLLALILLGALLAETVVFASLPVAGHAPAVVTLTVVGIAMADGSESGARYGFAAGLLVDLLGGGLMGLHAMVLALTGWFVGNARSYLTGTAVASHILAGGAATAAATTLYGLLSFVLDPEGVTASGLAQGVVVTALYSAALAPFVSRPVAGVARRAAASTPGQLP